MTRTVTAPNQKSAMPTLPTLSQMVRDGQADAIQHRRRTREALDYWFRQSERLNIAHTYYRLRGTRFTDFSRRIGVDRASAFRLIKLHKHRAAILAGCRSEEDAAIGRGEVYFFPGWRTALERYEGKPLRGRTATYAWRQGHEPACVASASSPKVSLYEGDNLTLLRSVRGSIQADVCITSPPYLPLGDTSNNYSPIRAKGQRKGGDKQWLTRRSLEEGYREKETLNVPCRLAEALRRDGWIHRSTLIWDKIGGSVVANSDAAPDCHEYVLHMIKWSSQRRRPYGNTLPLKSSVLRHHAVSHPRHGCVFPVSLVEELLSVCPAKPVIIDPYIGSGAVAVAANRVPESTVYGFDLNCSTAREAVPEVACCMSEGPATTSARQAARSRAIAP